MKAYGASESGKYRGRASVLIVATAFQIMQQAYMEVIYTYWQCSMYLICYHDSIAKKTTYLSAHKGDLF